MKAILILAPLFLVTMTSITPAQDQPLQAAPATRETVVKTEAEWKQQLTPEQYYILRQKGTERPFTSPLNDVHDHGVFKCAACGRELFSSDAKFDSGTGWPSFYQPISKEAVRTEEDHSFFSTRTEIVCAGCGGHLGHVFDDGPKPTGLRYCMNGVALKFEKQP